MFSSVMSAAICGVNCVPVRVEADVSSGLPVFNMVGYLSSQVREAQERVKTAIRNTKISLPPKGSRLIWRRQMCGRRGTGLTCPLQPHFWQRSDT